MGKIITCASIQGITVYPSAYWALNPKEVVIMYTPPRGFPLPLVTPRPTADNVQILKIPPADPYDD